MVNTLGERQSKQLRLKATFQEVLNFETQNVIELHFRFIEDTNANETTQERVT